MRTAKVKVNRECGVARPIRVHLTVTEANRLLNILDKHDADMDTGYEIDTFGFYRELSDSIDEATA
jgi:hypothetical protein